MYDLGLVDADSVYFRVACRTTNKTDIKKTITRTMQNIRRNCGTDRLLIAVKGHGNFRQDLYPKYKANRKELDDELRAALSYGHSFMVDTMGAVQSDGMEADDLVSIWASEATDMDTTYVVVGIDKDLLQIPGHHYNFVKETHQHIDVAAGHYNLMLQCLVGDSTDNIPGIRGIGPKKGAKLLDGVPMHRQWNRVRAAWRGHRAGDPVLSRRLLEMLTSWKEYDDIRDQLASQATECQPDVLEREEKQD